MVGALAGGVVVALDGLGATLVLAASATALSGIFAFAIRDRAPIVLQSRMTT